MSDIYVNLLKERSKYYIKKAKLEHVIRENTQGNHYQYSPIFEPDGE